MLKSFKINKVPSEQDEHMVDLATSKLDSVSSFSNLESFSPIANLFTLKISWKGATGVLKPVSVDHPSLLSLSSLYHNNGKRRLRFLESYLPPEGKDAPFFSMFYSFDNIPIGLKNFTSLAFEQGVAASMLGFLSYQGIDIDVTRDTLSYITDVHGYRQVRANIPSGLIPSDMWYNSFMVLQTNLNHLLDAARDSGILEECCNDFMWNVETIQDNIKIECIHKLSQKYLDYRSLHLNSPSLCHHMVEVTYNADGANVPYEFPTRWDGLDYDKICVSCNWLDTTNYLLYDAHSRMGYVDANLDVTIDPEYILIE